MRRLVRYLFLGLVVLMSALGFPPPVSPRHAIRPSQEQAEPVRRDA